MDINSARNIWFHCSCELTWVSQMQEISPGLVKDAVKTTFVRSSSSFWLLCWSLSITQNALHHRSCGHGSLDGPFCCRQRSVCAAGGQSSARCFWSCGGRHWIHFIGWILPKESYAKAFGFSSMAMTWTILLGPMIEVSCRLFDSTDSDLKSCW